MERTQLRKDLKHGMSDDTHGPVFHFARQQRPADAQADGAGDGLRGGSSLVEGLEREGEGASQRLGALFADISSKERLAVEALRQAKEAKTGSMREEQMSEEQRDSGDMAKDMRAVRQAFPTQDVAFMLDVENNYGWQDALEMAQELEEKLRTGFEDTPVKTFVGSFNPGK